MSGARQLDLDGATIRRSASTLDEPRLLHPIEVASEGRAFDADGPGELELGPPGVTLERIQDPPDRDRPAALGERAVERPADGL